MAYIYLIRIEADAPNCLPYIDSAHASEVRALDRLKEIEFNPDSSEPIKKVLYRITVSDDLELGFLEYKLTSQDIQDYFEGIHGDVKEVKKIFENEIG